MMHMFVRCHVYLEYHLNIFQIFRPGDAPAGSPEEDAKFFQFIPLARLRAHRRPVSKFQVALPPRAAHSRRW